MLISISTILSKVSERSWQTLSIGLAIAIGTSPIAGTLLLINSGSLSIKTPERTIDFKGKGKLLTVDSQMKIEKLEAQLAELNKSYQRLARVAKLRNVDSYVGSQIEKVEKEIVESEIRLEDVKQSQKEVEEFVESATADDTIEE